MNSLKKTFCLFLLLAASFTMLAQDTSEVLLRMQYTEGDSIQLRRSENTEMTIEMFGTKQHSTEVDIYDYLFEINELKNDTANIKMTFTGLYQKEESGEEVWEFDSNEKDMALDNIKTRMLFKMMGFSMDFNMNSMGEIKNFRGAEKLINLIVDDPELDLPDAHKEELKASIATVLNNDVFKQSFNQYFLYINEKPIKVGDRWKVESIIKQFGLSTKYIFTYVKKVGNEVILKIEGDIGSVEEGGSIDYAGMEIKYDMTGPISGMIKIDSETGWLLSENITMEMSGTMEVEQEGLDEAISANISLKITSSLKQVKD